MPTVDLYQNGNVYGNLGYGTVTGNSTIPFTNVTYYYPPNITYYPTGITFPTVYPTVPPVSPYQFIQEIKLKDVEKKEEKKKSNPEDELIRDITLED